MSINIGFLQCCLAKSKFLGDKLGEAVNPNILRQDRARAKLVMLYELKKTDFLCFQKNTFLVLTMGCMGYAVLEM